MDEEIEGESATEERLFHFHTSFLCVWSLGLGCISSEETFKSRFQTLIDVSNAWDLSRSKVGSKEKLT